MKKLFSYLPFHFLLFLISGICIQFYTNFWVFNFYKLLLLLGLLSFILLILKHFNKKKIFSVCSWLFFIFIGISTVFIHNPKNDKNYYIKHFTKGDITILEINNILKSSTFNHKYEANVIQTNQQKTTGKVLLNIKKDTTENPLKIGEQILLKPQFLKINPPKNPHQFNYKSYLVKQGIYQQIFINKNEFKNIETTKYSLQHFASSIRNKVQKSLKKHHFTNDEFAIINALLLGQRQEISTELQQSYTNAGAIHILAISGLHIGILMLLLSYFFKPLGKIKHGKLIKSAFIVVLLWVFAFIAGLSASVVRAVTMFTFITIGQSLHKKPFIEHSLIASMFVLLLVKPMFLFDIGFQLSYLAVFGIVWIQPLLINLWKPKSKIIYKVWELTSVSVSAQIGILPISLYYFHQFPSLFLLSNLVVIPILAGILIGGFLIIALSLLQILPQFLADFYGFIITTLNNFIKWIALQEQFLFKEISVSFLLMVSLYLFIIFGFQYIVRKKPKQFIYLLSSIILMQFVLLFEKYQRNNTEKLIVFHKNKNSIIGKRKGASIQVFSDLNTTKIQQQNLLNLYKTKEQVVFKTANTNPNIFRFNQKTILVVDSLGVYNIPALKNKIVLLKQSPKINLNRLISTLQPNLIIADGSNYKSYTNLWKQSCKQQKTPFYSTEQNGAYIISK